MIIISDTTCLSALVRIGELDILQKLFQKVIIPPKVHEELLALSAFNVDISVFSTFDWIEIQEPLSCPLLTQLLNILDPGESYAIALAVELQADWLIVDDLDARKIATQLNINLTGVGGVFIQAKDRGIIVEVKPYLDLIMDNAGFRLSTSLYNRILQLAGE